MLATHRGWDPGAWDTARYIAAQMNFPVYGCQTTRLLIETNRSRHNEQLFSEFTRPQNEALKNELLTAIYHPYRDTIEQAIHALPGLVFHLSIHSFTPVLDGIRREADIGLLFDPARKNEVKFCQQYLPALQNEWPHYTIRFNEPYKGTDDGFTTYLRTLFPDKRYCGIELELNQKFFEDQEGKNLQLGLVRALKAMLKKF